MNLCSSLRVFAGVMILISAALTYVVSDWWILFTVFIGLNLIQSAFTKNCPAVYMLKKMGYTGKL